MIYPLKRIGLMLASAIAILSSPWMALSMPMPNDMGDYKAPPRKTPVHTTWQVVDPDPKGLNCRMPRPFHGKHLDDRLPGDRTLTIGDQLLQNDKYPIGAWEALVTLKPGTKLYAFGGNLGVLIIVRDRQGKPWLPVVVTSDGRPISHKNRQGSCFVRANRRFIQPI